MNRGRIQPPLSASALDTGVVIVSVLSMEYLVLASGYMWLALLSVQFFELPL